MRGRYPQLIVDPMATRRKASSVDVFGEDPVIGRALELLLRSSVGYDVRFLAMTSLDKPGQLDGVQLLLFAGRLNAERRDFSMSFLKSVLPAVPILQSLFSLKGKQAETKNAFPSLAGRRT